jgi:hypothetical protein
MLDGLKETVMFVDFSLQVGSSVGIIARQSKEGTEQFGPALSHIKAYNS